MNTTVLSNAIDRQYKKSWVDAYEEVKPMIEKIYNVVDQEDKNEKEAAYSGLGLVPIVGEGQAYTDDAPIQTYTTTYSSVKRGLDTPVTIEMQMWDKSGVAGVDKIAKAHAGSVARTIEQVAANTFNYGFNTSYTSYGDAKPFFSVSHTRADGNGSVSNASATGLPLNNDNLDVLTQQLRLLLDDRGQIRYFRPNVLLVPPALEQTALIVTKSTNRSGTSDNDKNVFGMKEYTGGSLNVIVWDFLSVAGGGSNTAFFVGDTSSMNNKLTWKWGQKPKVAQLDKATGAKSDVLYFKESFHYSLGWSDFRPWVGSKGDGLTYAS